LVLFKGQCAACHVAKGKGKTGEALFVADCAMCHGLNATGGVAPSLVKQNYNDPAQKARMKDIISNGAPHNPEMPPFSLAKGGPLNEAEIDSLVNFIVYKSTLSPGAETETDEEE
jgi:mono/diheme cytochrome c family protein